MSIVNVRRNFDGKWQCKEFRDEPWKTLDPMIGLTFEEIRQRFSDRGFTVHRLADIPHPTSYHCQINEYQRKMLVDVMTAVKLRPDMVEYMRGLPGDYTVLTPESNMLREFEILIDLLVDLPKDENDHPGGIHGLCL